MSNILWSEFLQAGFRARSKFPELLKFIMYKTDTKRKEIAHLLGVGPPYVSDLLNRKKSPDGPLIIAALSTALIWGTKEEVFLIIDEKPAGASADHGNDAVREAVAHHTPEISSYREIAQKTQSSVATARKPKIRRASSAQSKG